jgi:hypothetical protein
MNNKRNESTRERTIGRSGVLLTDQIPAMAPSAAESALGWQKRTSPSAKSTPTIQSETNAYPRGTTAPHAKSEIERRAGQEVSATHCTYPVAVKRVLTQRPDLRRAWEAQGKPRIFDTELDDLLRWASTDG